MLETQRWVNCYQNSITNPVGYYMNREGGLTLWQVQGSTWAKQLAQAGDCCQEPEQSPLLKTSSSERRRNSNLQNWKILQNISEKFENYHHSWADGNLTQSCYKSYWDQPARNISRERWVIPGMWAAAQTGANLCYFNFHGAAAALLWGSRLDI